MIAVPRLTLCLALLCLAVPSQAQQGGDDPIWTTEPTRIDRARQTYERLPARTAPRDSRIWVTVPERIKVLDSAHFSVGDTVYEIAHIRPVPAKRLCRAIEGGRWACGRMASIFLGNLVRGKRLLCDIAQDGKKVTLSRCVIGSRDVAASIVSQGYGKAEGDAALLAIEAEARKLAAKGLWRNPECAADFDRC